MLFVIIITAAIILILIASYQSHRERNKFLEKYKEFLNKNEGQEFFCYTNRKDFVEVIEEQLIPKLDSRIKIIKLEGKDPITYLNREFISYTLNRLINIGFPNVMKITHGVVKDISLHNEIYNAINNKKFSDLQPLIEDALSSLRRPKHSQ
jgi:hypothetical protein